jgi:hypothetical protein
VKAGLAPGDEVVLHPLGLKADDLLEPTEQMASNQ